MVFEFTDEQLALRDAVRSFASAVSPESAIRKVLETESGYDAQVWGRMADEVGLQGLIIPSEYGGAGAGMVEQAVVLDELGRALYPGPYLSTVLATCAILAAADETTRQDLLPGIASGECIATLAVAEAGGRWDESSVMSTAAPGAHGWSLTGTKQYVTDGLTADLVVIAARTSDGVELFAVRADAPGQTRTPLTVFDLTRRLATVTLDETPGRRLATGPLDPDVFGHVLDLARVATSAEQAGTARAVLDMAVQYAKDRVQFGRAIGSFQAIKHLVADALLDVESAVSAAYYAAWAAADENPELATVAPLAKAFCSDTALKAAELNIQVHGGIAFTWEHSAHLYYRRAKSSAQLWGDAGSHRDLLAARLGL
jgi:alkylation response protein AidB-like acyl-CoA dehydrogenase